MKWARPYGCAVALVLMLSLSAVALQAAGNALFVVGNLTLSASDVVLKNQLTNGLTMTVTTVLDTAALASDATGKDLVVISGSVLSTNVGNRFRTVLVPVWLGEEALFDDMDMCSAAGLGNTTGQTQLRITNASSFLAAGLSAGLQTVYSPSATLNWGQPNANAIVVAEDPGTSANKVIFAYDTGAVMFNSLAAPARRLGLFTEDLAPANLNATGLLLLNASFQWLLGYDIVTPTMTATVSPSPSPTATPSASPSNSPSPSFSPTITPSFTLSATPTFSSTVTGTSTASVTETDTETSTSTFTPTITGTFSPTATETDTETSTQTSTPTPTSTFSATITGTFTSTATSTDTQSSTQTPTVTPTFSASITGTFTPTVTATETGTSTQTPTVTATASPTASATPSDTATATLSATASRTASASPSSTATGTSSATPTDTLTATSSASCTATLSASPSYSATASNTASATATASPTPSLSSTATPSITVSPSATITGAYTLTPTPVGALILHASILDDAGRLVRDLGDTFSYSFGSDIQAAPVPMVPEKAPLNIGVGTAAWTWTGENSAGATIPNGAYRVKVTQAGGPDLERAFVLTHAGAGVDRLMLAPNPARGPRVSIAWAPKPGAEATVKIYTLNGDLVALKNAPGGNGHVDWDLNGPSGAAVSSGIYLVRIELHAGGQRFSDLRKLAVLR